MCVWVYSMSHCVWGFFAAPFNVPPLPLVPFQRDCGWVGGGCVDVGGVRGKGKRKKQCSNTTKLYKRKTRRISTVCFFALWDSLSLTHTNTHTNTHTDLPFALWLPIEVCLFSSLSLFLSFSRCLSKPNDFTISFAELIVTIVRFQLWKFSRQFLWS